MEHKTNPPSARQIYKELLNYTASRQNALANNASLQIKDVFDLAEEVVNHLKASDDLISLAVLYFDPADLTISHAANVTILATRLAMGLNYSHDQLVQLASAGILHDIGTGRISPQIVAKEPAQLTAAELREFEHHSYLGYESIQKSAPSLTFIADVIYQHHEKCNGSGYPRHLRRNELLQDACVLSMIDTYEALIHPRQHRDALVPPKGIQEIIEQRGTAFAPELVRALIQQISIYPVGCHVQLATGEIGRVIRINAGTPVRPLVKLLLDKERRPIDGKTLDLKADYLNNITRCVPPPYDISKLLN